MDILSTINSKVPYQANNATSPLQGQQGGKDAISAYSGVRAGTGAERGQSGQGGA